MTHDRKNEVFKELFESCLELQYGKAKDYATNSDALSNFKSQDAEALGLTPFQKWGVYFGKQAMSILGAIGKNPSMPSTTSEPIEERINDAIIYLVLFKCLLEDMKGDLKDTHDLESNAFTKNPASRAFIKKDDEENNWIITLENKLEKTEFNFSKVLLYSEDNPFKLIEFQPIQLINDKTFSAVIIGQMEWLGEDWEYENIEENNLDTENTWFLYSKN